jgi:hypothetical protein
MGRGAGDRSARSPCRSTARLIPVITYVRGHCGHIGSGSGRAGVSTIGTPWFVSNGSNSAPKRLAFVDASAQARTCADKAITYNFLMSSGRRRRQNQQ